MLMRQKPKCENKKITTIKTSMEAHLCFKSFVDLINYPYYHSNSLVHVYDYNFYIPYLFCEILRYFLSILHLVQILLSIYILSFN